MYIYTVELKKALAYVRQYRQYGATYVHAANRGEHSFQTNLGPVVFTSCRVESEDYKSKTKWRAYLTLNGKAIPTKLFPSLTEVPPMDVTTCLTTLATHIVAPALVAAFALHRWTLS